MPLPNLLDKYKIANKSASSSGLPNLVESKYNNFKDSKTDTPVVAPPKKQSLFSKAVSLPGKAIQFAGDQLAKTYGENIERGLYEQGETGAEKVLKMPASLVGGAGPENLPLGIGSIVQEFKNAKDPNNTETFYKVTFEDFLTGWVETGKAIDKMPFQFVANLAGTPIKFDLPYIGEVTNRQFNAAKRIQDGEDPIYVTAEEGIGSVFDSLMLVGMYRGITAPRHVKVGSVTLPENFTTPKGPVKSFRLSSNPNFSKLPVAPVSEETFAQIVTKYGLNKGAKYDPKLPTYVTGSGKPNALISGEVWQVKPSYLKTFTNLFNKPKPGIVPSTSPEITPAQFASIPISQKTPIITREVNLNEVKNTLATKQDTSISENGNMAVQNNPPEVIPFTETPTTPQPTETSIQPSELQKGQTIQATGDAGLKVTGPIIEVREDGLIIQEPTSGLPMLYKSDKFTFEPTKQVVPETIEVPGVGRVEAIPPKITTAPKSEKIQIQELEKQTENTIKIEVKNYIEQLKNNLELEGLDFVVKDIKVVGSRTVGLAKKISDLDVLLEYSGSSREDDMFNALNQKKLKIDGIKVDINPIRAQQTGTMKDVYKDPKEFYKKEKTSGEVVKKSEPKKDVSKEIVKPKTPDEQAIEDYVNKKNVKFRTKPKDLVVFKPERPLTSKFLEHPDVKGKEVVSYNFLYNLAKSSSFGLKAEEREIVQNVLETLFKNNPKINMEEFRRAVIGDMLPVDIIPSDTYANYGADNIGLGDLDAKTYIVNTPFEHGNAGHFSNDFHKTLLESELEIKEIPVQEGNPTVKFAVVKKGVALTADNVQENTFTMASSKEDAQKWIDNHIAGADSSGKMVDVVKKGLFGHFRTLDDANGTDDGAGISYLIEVQADPYQGRPDTLENREKRSGSSRIKIRAVDSFGVTGRINSKKIEIEGWRKELVQLEEALKEEKSLWEKDPEYDEKFDNGAIGSLKDRISSLEIKINKNTIELEKNLELQPISKEEKLFLSYKGIWHERLMREAIHTKANEGFKILRFPTPRTIAVIEGYTVGEDGDMAPYEYEGGRDTELVVGDTIDYGGEEMTVLQADSDSITVAPSEGVRHFNADDAMEEDIQNQWDEAVYGFDTLEKDFGITIDSIEKAQEVVDNIATYNKKISFINKDYDIAKEREYLKNKLLDSRNKNGLSDKLYQAEERRNMHLKFIDLLNNDIVGKEKMTKEKFDHDNGGLAFKDKLEKKYGIEHSYWNYIADIYNYGPGTPTNIQVTNTVLEKLSRIFKGIVEDVKELKLEVKNAKDYTDDKIAEIKKRESPTPAEINKLPKKLQEDLAFTGKKTDWHGSYNIDYNTEQILQEIIYSYNEYGKFSLDNYEDSFKITASQNYEPNFEDVYGEGHVFYEGEGSRQEVWVTEKDTEQFNQPSGYDQTSSIEDFNIEDFSGEERAVLDFYKKQGDAYFEKIRKEDVSSVIDDNGYEWLETNLTKKDMEAPTVYRLKDDLSKVGIEVTDAQEAEIFALNEKIFGDQNVKIMGQILANEQALGSYQSGIIRILAGQANPKDTYLHEVVHKYLDVFTDRQEYIEILKEAQARYGIKDLGEVEEKLAEDFIKYARDKENSTLWQKLKDWFDKILSRIKKYLGNSKTIEEFYNDIISGKAAREAKTNASARGPTKISEEIIQKKPQPTSSPKTPSVVEQVLKTKQIEPNQQSSVSSKNNITDEILSQGEEIPTLKDMSPKLEETRVQLEIMKESLDNNQAQFLAKYEATSGAFKGELPEVTGKSIEELKASSFYGKMKNKNALEFARRGDQLVEGFDDSEKAREAYADYKDTLEKYKIYLKQYRADLKEYNTSQKDARAIERILNKQEAIRRDIIQEEERHIAFVNRIYGKGFKAGVKVGQKEARASIMNQLRNTLDEIKRSNELGILKEKIKTRDFDRVKDEIVNYVKENIPISNRGVFLNMVKDARSQNDLIRAFTRIDNKSEEIILNNAIKDLKNTADTLSESSSVAVDYRNKIKDIIGEYELKGHQQATIAKLQATQDYIDKQRAEGIDVELPQRIINKLGILSRTPKDQLTLSQVQGLKAEIELLGRLGETKWATKQALYDGEKDTRKNVLLQTSTPINKMEGGKKVIGEKPSAWVDRYIKLRNYLQKTNIGLTPIDGLADITGMQPMKAALDLNYGNYLTYNDKAITDWHELTKDFTTKEFERIGAVAMARQEGGMERLANSGITPEEVDAITLTPEEETAYNFVRDTFESEFPAVKKYAQDVYNKDVGQVDNYVSYMSDYEEMSDLEMYDRFGQRAEEISDLKTKTVEQGFTKERAGVSKIKLELDINKIFRRHIDDVAYMLTSGRDIKMYSEIVNSPEMREKLGEVGTLAWKQYLDLMARKGGSEGAKRIAALDILRRNMGAGILGFRLSSALVQFSSFADTLGTIGVEYSTKGASHIATSREWRNFVMDNFPEVKKAVGDDIAFREFGDGMLGNLSRVGMKPLQILDGIMRSTAIAGAYEKLADAKGIKIDLANPDRALIQEATRLMRNSQGSSFFKDQPLALTAGYGLADNKSINKTILTFQSFMLNRWDNIQRQIWRLGIKEKNYTKAGMSFLWMIIVAAIMEEGIRRGGRALINLVTGDDQEEKSFTGNAVLNVTQNVPILGSLISSMTYSSNPVPVINTFEEVIGGFTSAVTGTKLSTKIRGATTALGGIGALSGIPGASQSAQILKKIIPTEETSTDKAKKEIEKLNELSVLEQNNQMAKWKISEPSLYSAVKKIQDDQKSGITEEEKKIRDLGVENLERARYIYKQMIKLGSTLEQNAYLADLRKKKVVTDEVFKQINNIRSGILKAK